MSHEPKILVILTPGFPKDEEDSNCLPAQQLLVKALNRCYPALSIVILAFEYPFSRAPYLWHQNRVIPFDGWDKGKIKKVSMWVWVWQTLRKLRKENEVFGLLSFWCTSSALIGSHFGKWHGIPHFIWILGQDARKDNRFVPFIRPKAEELVAMSDFLSEEFFRNHSIRPRHMIPNGVDASIPPSAEGKRDIELLGVGSLIPLKQYDLFLSLIRELKAELPSIRAFICGKGPEKMHLEALIGAMQLQDNVVLTGELPHDEILGLMGRARILLHTSSYEGFSTVCLEALYAGAHVISFCQPTHSRIQHWHIAVSRTEMLRQVLAILQDPGTDHTPVLVRSMDDSAREMMKLFNFS